MTKNMPTQIVTKQPTYFRRSNDNIYTSKIEIGKKLTIEYILTQFYIVIFLVSSVFDGSGLYICIEILLIIKFEIYLLMLRLYKSFLMCCKGYEGDSHVQSVFYHKDEPYINVLFNMWIVCNVK